MRRCYWSGYRERSNVTTIRPILSGLLNDDDEAVTHAAHDNPDLPRSFVADTLQGLAEVRDRHTKPYPMARRGLVGMDKKLFRDLVTSLKQAKEMLKASRRKHGGRLAERIREKRELLQMTSPRAFRKRR
jgi:hypothetical protein